MKNFLIDRPQLKIEMREMLNSHFPFFLLLFLPVLIMELGFVLADYLPVVNTTKSSWNLGVYLDALTTNGPRWSFSGSPNQLTMGLALVILLAIISELLLTGIQFVAIDLVRNKATFDQPVTKSFTIFNNGDYFLGTIMINIIAGILTFLWSLLFIVPGIIKAFAYSQAVFIYRDALDQGEKISYLEAITRSRQLMDGHKMDLFVFNLSYIGWNIVSNLTLNLLDIWLLPYYNLALANFYVKIHDDQSDPLQTILTDNHASNDADQNHSDTPK